METESKTQKIMDNIRVKLLQRFWNKISMDNNLHLLEERIKFVLRKYGTTLRENRFAAGMYIEDDLSEYLSLLNFETFVVPQAQRIDIDIQGIGQFSVKYSKSNVILHNSRGENTDVEMVDSLIFTPTNLYMIIPKLLPAYGINLTDYLHNKKDSLELNKRIFKELKQVSYPFVQDIDLFVPKEDCQHLSVKKFLKNDVDMVLPWK